MGGLRTQPSKLGTHNQFWRGEVPGKRAGVSAGQPPETRPEGSTWLHLSFNSSYFPQASDKHKLLVTAATQACMARCGVPWPEGVCVLGVPPGGWEPLGGARQVQEAGSEFWEPGWKGDSTGWAAGGPSWFLSRGAVGWKASKSRRATGKAGTKHGPAESGQNEGTESGGDLAMGTPTGREQVGGGRWRGKDFDFWG